MAAQRQEGLAQPVLVPVQHEPPERALVDHRREVAPAGRAAEWRGLAVHRRRRYVAIARSLAAQLGLDARFVESDLYDLRNRLEGEFDVVYTSRGVLGWLPDIRGWAEVAAHFVRPGGIFYVTEVHPVWEAFEYDGVEPGRMWLRYPYWESGEPFAMKVVGSYADRSADVGDLTEYGWNHSLGEIVTSLIDAGLRIEFLHEFPFLEW